MPQLLRWIRHRRQGSSWGRRLTQRPNEGACASTTAARIRDGTQADEEAGDCVGACLGGGSGPVALCSAQGMEQAKLSVWVANSIGRSLCRPCEQCSELLRRITGHPASIL